MFLGSVEEAISYGSNTFMIYTGAPQNTRRKPIEELNIEQCNDEAIMEMEMETINCPVTKTPEWYSLENGEVENVKIKITEIDTEAQKIKAVLGNFFDTHEFL